MEVLAGVPDQRLVQEWAELVEATAAPPWMSPGWVLPWWKHMGSGTPALVAGRGVHGALRALLPLQARRGALLSATNWHTPEYAAVAEDAAARRDVLTAALSAARGRLTLDFVDQPQAHEVAEVTRCGGGRTRVSLLETSPYLALDEDWEAGVDRRVMGELRRRRRRLEERGALTFEMADGTQHLHSLLREGFRVEASGWKGREGSAIACSPSTEAFYRAVAVWAAEQGCLRLCFLRLDDHALAFDFAVEHRGVHSLLKTGFDEAQRAAGPGKLLRLHVLRDCTDRGVQRYEFLGTEQDWKREWTTMSRQRLRVHAFPRGAPGTASYLAIALVRPRVVAAGAAVKRRGRALLGAGR